MWVTDTSSERITDTVDWHPTPAMFPGTSSLDLLTTAHTDLERAIRALQQTLGDTTVNLPEHMIDTCRKLTGLFSKRTTNSVALETPPTTVSNPSMPIATPDTVNHNAVDHRVLREAPPAVPPAPNTLPAAATMSPDNVPTAPTPTETGEQRE